MSKLYVIVKNVNKNYVISKFYYLHIIKFAFLSDTYGTREGTCEFYFLTCSDDLICCSNDLISCLQRVNTI